MLANHEIRRASSFA
jgi:hypothetical protein